MRPDWGAFGSREFPGRGSGGTEVKAEEKEKELGDQPRGQGPRFKGDNTRAARCALLPVRFRVCVDMTYHTRTSQ